MYMCRYCIYVGIVGMVGVGPQIMHKDLKTMHGIKTLKLLNKND